MGDASLEQVVGSGLTKTTLISYSRHLNKKAKHNNLPGGSGALCLLAQSTVQMIQGLII
ncbi:uncharacterized protein BDV14DRAFT_167491 [Aspergillus stella-maris]|uniref:uncharacterized protein n=1 Tax=Aspergillus stella-maris TaxID=1810926 RepID=UPI003CCE2266